MSTAEILAQLARLSPAEREQVRDRLDALDAAAPLSAEEQRAVDQRVAAYRQNPAGCGRVLRRLGEGGRSAGGSDCEP